MFYQDSLSIVKDLPGPDGVWELVEQIGKKKKKKSLHLKVLLCVSSKILPFHQIRDNTSGEGNYGEVFKARNLQTGKIAAAKIMDAVLDKEEDIKAELNVFQKHAHHPNLVDFFGAFVKRDPIADDQIWIVMEVR